MSIIILIAFMGVVAAMETISKRHYIARFFHKAEEIYAFIYGCILAYTGLI